MDGAEFDTRMMRLAIATARRGLGQTAPNPSVGAVVAHAKSGEVIARAVTAPGGRPHAESQALAKAGAAAQGATLYVTLEPCSHHGETLPCVEGIIGSGLSRVVVGIQDPDPRVAGQGLAKLRAAHIAVQSGVAAREADWLTRGHILRISQHRPFVQLKLALASDGSVPRGGKGQPSWVTSPLSRAVGHQLRAEADAILIGAATMHDDDPALTCRLPGLEARSPVRIVVTSDLQSISQTQLYATRDTAPLWLVYSDGSGEVVHDVGAVDLNLSAPSDDRVERAQVRVEDLLHALAGRGVTRLLVEGGPKTWRRFQDAGLVDEVVVFVGAKDAHHPGAGDAIQAMVSQHLGCDPGPSVSARSVGHDACFTFRPPALTSLV